MQTNLSTDAKRFRNIALQVEDALLRSNPRYAIPPHVCTCGGKGCASLKEARKRYPLPWRIL